MHNMDEKILAVLKKNAREPYVKIAKSTGLQESSVRRRVREMARRGVIKRFTVEMGDTDTTQAIVFVSVESSTDTSAVSARLIKVRGVITVYEITGQHDIAGIIRTTNITDINRAIDEVRKIDGVTDTNSVIILRTLTESIE